MAGTGISAGLHERLIIDHEYPAFGITLQVNIFILFRTKSQNFTKYTVCLELLSNGPASVEFIAQDGSSAGEKNAHDRFLRRKMMDHFTGRKQFFL